MVDFIQIGTTPNIVSSKESSLKRVEENTEANNPIFNFKQDFVDQLQSITTMELASSVPFIGLRAIDDQGKILHDFNQELFFKPIDFSKINSGERFSDRPTASLSELKIKSSTSSGYIYFQDVVFTIKLHKPDITLNSILISLLFPGMPMELEYGWKNVASKNKLLNSTEILTFALKSYAINYNIDGQVDLTIDGTAFSERFTSTYVGDEGDNISELFNAKAQGKKQLIAKQKDLEDILNKGSLTNALNTIINQQEYLQDLKNNPDKSAKRDLNLVKDMTESFQKADDIVRGPIRKHFHDNFAKLSQYKDSGSQYIEGGKGGKQTKLFKNDMITVHDLVSTLCRGTFDALSKLNPGCKIRVVYGNLHDEAGKNKGQFRGSPIGDFPIDFSRFCDLVGKYVHTKGTEVLTMQALFDEILIREFFHDEGHWRKLESAKTEGIKLPLMYVAINNYKANNQKFMDICLIDINRDVPSTSKIVDNLIQSKQGKVTTAEFEQAIRNESKNIPIIKLGHSNAFIKEISMSNVMDEYMKSTLIARMAQQSSTYTRDFIPSSLQNAVGSSDTNTPLHLPIQGSMTVLGNSQWKPFKAFALLSGIFPLDAVYSILSVEHTINNSGFTTKFEFIHS